VKDSDLVSDLDAIVVRPIGRGSLEEIIFRLDVIHRLERLGVPIFNPPSAIEKAVDKYYALTLMEESDLPVPRTMAVERHEDALRAFDELGGDVVVKPIFGSRGIGTTRVTDREIATRIFRSLAYNHHVVYIQEFVEHGTRDIRAFVIGDRVVAAMHRQAEGWKTNVSQGARPIKAELSYEVNSIALKASRVIGCEIAGVDIMESARGPLVAEINSQPGWRGLQQTTEVDIAEEIARHVIWKAGESRGSR